GGRGSGGDGGGGGQFCHGLSFAVREDLGQKKASSRRPVKYRMREDAFVLGCAAFAVESARGRPALA
ncbi:MAG: hypothetical protein LC129_08590, partial [Burkholderiales bacterium]|nr:hypothetical protein [Burkholderiales bacterium]